MKALSWYIRKLETHPISTKAISSVMIFGLGDILCQKLENYLEEENKIFDYKRFIKQSSYGLIAGPYLHLQFCVIVPYLFPTTAKFHTLKSVIYALTVSDSFYNCGFYLYCDALDGKFFQLNTFVEKFIPTQIVNLKVWPVLQYINFSIVPVKFRVLYDNTLSIFWNAYLSWIQNNLKKKIKKSMNAEILEQNRKDANDYQSDNNSNALHAAEKAKKKDYSI